MEKIIEKPGVRVFLYKIQDRKINYAIFRRAEDWDGFEVLKGGSEKDETPEVTAKREVLEEAGIEEVELVKSKEEEIFFSEKEGVKRRHCLTVFFANIGDKEVKISEEHSNLEFMSFDQAFEKLPFEDIKNLLKKVDLEIHTYENL